jgi:ketosteroid isomerase-like protein
MVRFPGVWRRAAAIALRRLPPSSRLRREILVRNALSAYDSATRRDFGLMFVRYAEDVEWEFDPEFDALGMSGTFRGHAGALKMIDAFGEAWEEWTMYPEIVIDLGENRGVSLGRFHLPGTASGLEFDRQYGQVLTARDGLVVREQDFLDWEKALRAAGLDPATVELPARGTATATR